MRLGRAVWTEVCVLVFVLRAITDIVTDSWFVSSSLFDGRALHARLWYIGIMDCGGGEKSDILAAKATATSLRSWRSRGKRSTQLIVTDGRRDTSCAIGRMLLTGWACFLGWSAMLGGVVEDASLPSWAKQDQLSQRCLPLSLRFADHSTLPMSQRVHMHQENHVVA